MATTFTVKTGQTIGDVVLQSTGNIVNWDAILTANDCSSWVPLFEGGEVVIIPDGVLNDANNQRGLNVNPPTNNAINVYGKIDAVFALLP